MDDKYNDLIGDILKRSGLKDNYQDKGKGEPLPREYMQMDTFQHFQKIAREAGFLPPWLELQKEISKLVNGCKTNQDVEIINKKIKKYNLICPTKMQRMLISLEEIERAKKVWS